MPNVPFAEHKPKEMLRWMPNTLPTKNDPKKKMLDVRLMFFLQGSKPRSINGRLLDIFLTRNGPSRHEKMSGGCSIFFSQDKTKQKH
jgi:hypothetical protein